MLLAGVATVTLSQGMDGQQRAEFHLEDRFLACNRDFPLRSRHEFFKRRRQGCRFRDLQSATQLSW